MPPVDVRPPQPSKGKRRRSLAWVLGGVALGAAAAVVTVWLLWTPALPAAADAHDVPLGVEEAVIIRYAGPRLAARPYRRGASVNLRIAAEVAQGQTRVYDVRYVVNLPGEFNLIDYLAAADGRALDGLPPFVVNGQTRLTKDIETRIRELEEVPIEIWHGYYETLSGLGALWGLWLLGLILVGRPRRAARPRPPPPAPSAAELIAGYLQRLAEAGLSVEDKARLEILLLRHWREQLRLEEGRLAAACRQLRGSDPWGRAYQTLESWLHDPATPVGSAEVLRACGLPARPWRQESPS